MDRQWAGDYDDRYISSWDGKISKLVVQAVDEIYDNNTGSTYRRTFIRNVAPFYLRLANWPFNHVDPRKNNGMPTSEGENLYTLYDMVQVEIVLIVPYRLSHALSKMVHRLMRYHLCSMSTIHILNILSNSTELNRAIQISSPTPATSAPRNNGNYDPIPYQFWGYPKVAKNALETDRPRGTPLTLTNPIAERVLRPRYLCFLRGEGEPAMIMNVEEWYAERSFHVALWF